jgi:hypothetical protein
MYALCARRFRKTPSGSDAILRILVRKPRAPWTDFFNKIDPERASLDVAAKDYPQAAVNKLDWMLSVRKLIELIA